MNSLQPALDFTPDSPFFAKSIDDFTKDIDKLSEYLRCLVQLMSKFCNDLKSTSAICQAMSIQMKDGFQSSTTHQNLIPVIGSLGNIFDEISSSQEILSNSLETTFVKPLEMFYNETISSISILKAQYINERRELTDAISKYLQSEVSNTFIRGQPPNQVEFRALEVANIRKYLELTRFELVRKINEVEAKKSFELSETCIASGLQLRTHFRECNERLNSRTTFSDDVIYEFQQQRQLFIKHQPILDRQRSDISFTLDAMIERVENQLTPSTPTTLENLFLPSQSNDVSDNGMDSIANMSYAAGNTISKWIGFSSTSHESKKRGSFFGKDARSNSFTIKNDIHTSIDNVEVKMKVLDKTELSNLYKLKETDNFSNVESILMQSYVLERSVAFGKIMPLTPIVWTRKWLVLDETKLYFIKEGDYLSDPLEIQIVCDLTLCTIRELNHNYSQSQTSTPFNKSHLSSVDIPYCFEIVHGNIKTFTIQAEGYQDYSSWIKNIRIAIERRLVSGPTHQAVASPPRSESAELVRSLTLERNAIKQQLLDSNNFCSECNRPNPYWVSLNLGCFMCIECSGIHRSLGVHISKVRSLTLDDLDLQEYRLLQRIGNKLNLELFESGLNDSNIEGIKPHQDADYSTRESFIKNKYVLKRYVEPSIISSQLLYRFLLNACRDDAVSQVLSLLVHHDAIDINHYFDVNDVPRENQMNHEPPYRFINCTPLCIAIQHGSLNVVVLLILNGADITLLFKPIQGNPSTETLETNEIEAVALAKKYHRHDVMVYLQHKAELLGLSQKHPLDHNLTSISESTKSPTSPQEETRESRSYSNPIPMVDIGEKLYNASESSAAGKVLEKFYTHTDVHMDKLKTGIAKVFKQAVSNAPFESNDITNGTDSLTRTFSRSSQSSI